jgi:membrane-associated phospholipid phosphatase
VKRVTTAVEEQLHSPWSDADDRDRVRRRWLLSATLAAFVGSVLLFGFPTGREVITLWLLLTLLAACAGHVGVWRRAVVRDWLPLLAVLWAYDLLRGVANEIGGALFGLHTWCAADTLVECSTPGHLTARAHLTAPITADQAMFGGHVPTVWLQEHLFTAGTAHWYDVLVVPVYLSHFLVSLLLAVVLWCRSYTEFRRYLTALVGLTVAAVSTYVLYPMVPPWMASLNPSDLTGVHIHRVVQETLTTLGGSQLGSKVEQGAAYSNRVAAMPSLHAAIPMLLLLLFFNRVGVVLRVVLVLNAAGMAFALVYGGEHYVTDVLAGWAYAALTVLATERLRRGPTSTSAT